MTNIQLDMFEVQLGAGILIQFGAPSEEPVRILADAGVHASGYYSDHVLRKLPGCFKAFNNSSSPYEIDLMVGTHYDRDHLEGLVDVVNDEDIKIKEAWLPPVANDADGNRLEFPLSDADLLANQFAGEAGDTVFRNYVSFHRRRCEEAESIENDIITVVRESEMSGADELRYLRSNLDERPERSPFSEAWPDDPGKIQKFFEDHYESANQRLPEGFRGGHADSVIDELSPEDLSSVTFRDFSDSWWPISSLRFENSLRDSHQRRELLFSLARQPADMGSLMTRAALIRKSSAANAVNASSLNKLVKALKKKGVPIRSEYISAGQPEYYKSSPSGFRPFGKVSKQAYNRLTVPKITLMGPSRALIAKHKNILPIGTYLAFASTAIPIRSITPSNQLSYVLKLEYNDQKILIVGDAGCVDFKQKGSRAYYPDLLAGLDQLHIVQVAHHGGNNAHFYRVLLDAGYGSNTNTESYLLLSHATYDKYRPSRAFEQFALQLENNRVQPKLVFTSKPDAVKVMNIKHLANSAVGNRDDKGDVRLSYDGRWTVEQHAIQL